MTGASPRTAYYENLFADLRARVERCGVPVEFDTFNSATLHGLYFQPSPCIILARREPRWSAMCGTLLHEFAHHLRRNLPYTYALQEFEECVVQQAAGIALFQLTGECGYFDRLTGRYLSMWNCEKFADPAQFADPADSTAGELLRALYPEVYA